jgi:hypothetical protein
VDKLAGTIWHKTINGSELGEYERNYNVLSTHLLGGRTNVRVHATGNPADGFLPAEPDLRDVYFLTLRRS